MAKEKSDKKDKKDIKAKNNRYSVISNARKVFDKFFREERYERLSDFYEELGEYSGASPSTIAQMRLNGLAPSYAVAIKISEFLGVNPTDIWEVVELENYEPRPRCIIEGCGGTATTKGFCMRHIYLLKDVKSGFRISDHEFRGE